MTYIRYFVCLIVLSFLAISCGVDAIGESADDTPMELLTYVDPFIGTGFHGHTFPGPVMSNGMVQLSPDTRLNGWDASSGYHDSDSTIYGFSHTHLSGTGIGDLGDILVLPYTSHVHKKPIATFTKENEYAEVGYYRVRFSNYQVQAELTSNVRVGYHRYQFDEGTTPRVMLDPSHVLQRTWSADNLHNEIEIVGDRIIQGMRQSTGWAYDHPVYFYMVFSQPFQLEKVYNEVGELPTSTQFSSRDLIAHLRFSDTLSTLQIQVAISPVDVAGAKKNWEEEGKSGFDEIRRQNQEAWNQALNILQVKSQDEEVMKSFYTALYHTMIAPMIFQDVDGRYRGMDKKIHQSDQPYYTVFSLWDTFRALHPLLTIINPQKASYFVNSLLAKYQQGGLLPKWPLVSNYTGTMVGYPAVSLIADALAKGLPGIDKTLALEASLFASTYHPEVLPSIKEPRASQAMSKHIDYLNRYEFIPADSISESVSYGLECAYYDWCIAQIAEFNEDQQNVEQYNKRALYYRHYFDKEVGFMRGKLADKSWHAPFSPRYSSHARGDFVEGNAWQWSWFVPHDVPGLIELMGGKNAFLAKLDSLFSTDSTIEGEDASGDITGLIGQYAHGNEPSHHIAYLYTYAGQPWKTQEIVDQILYTLYAPTKDGISGNEDCGQMSAWYILNALGFYQMCPGDPVYTIGRPLIDEANIPLGNGKQFRIIVKNNHRDNRYVQSILLNGQKRNNFFFSHQELIDGGQLELVMGSLPPREVQ